MIKNNKYKIYIFFILISLAFTIILFGPENFKFTNISWISYHDMLAHQVAWKFFYNDIWHFPLGKNPNYGLDIGSSIVFTEAVPLLSFIFKIFKNYLPNNFQFFSFWIFLCFFLQLLFSYLIIYHYTQNKEYSIISSFIFLLSPVLLYRIPMHIALVGQWIILASLFAETIKKEKIKFYYWIIILSLSSLIHFYFTLMLSLIYAIFVFDKFLINKNLLKSLKEIFITFSFLLFVMYISGYFEIPLTDSLRYGYGYYKANLLSFFNPESIIGNSFSWSNFLPRIPTVGGEFEGFSYLGLGGIILFILLFFFFVKRDPLLNFKKNRPYYLLAITFFIISISNTINFGSFLLLDISLPKFLYALLSILRVSGRFVWPIYYLIFIAGLVLIYKKIETKKNALIILIFIFFVQVIDISSGLKNYVNSKIFQRFEKFTLTDPMWNLISKDFENIRITYLKNSPNVLSMTAGILLNGNFKKTDIFALGGINRNKASIIRNKTYENFRNNKLDENTIFIVNDKNHLRNLKFLLNESNNGLFFRNNLWILIPNYKNKMNTKDWDKFNKINFVEIFPEKEKKLYINDQNNVIGFGWTHNLYRQGVWTEGNEASIIFKLKKYEPRDYTLRFKIKSVMTNNIDKLKMSVVVNDKLAKKLTFDRFTNKDNKFIDVTIKKEDLRNELHKVDFKIENPISPVSLLENPDGRGLGLLVESIQIN